MTNLNKIIQGTNFIAFAIFLVSSNVSAQRILKYSDHEPFVGMRTKFLNDVFFPAIEKESNGRLKLKRIRMVSLPVLTRH